MTHYRKMLPLAFAAMLLLSGCELADVIEVAVSGPHCGKSGIPPELEERNLHLFGDTGEPYPLDETIAVLEPYEDSHGPDALFALGLTYLRKGSTLSDDPAYYRRGVRLLAWAALCGQPLAAYFLGRCYDEGVVGVDKNPERGACLIRLHDMNNFVPRTFEDGPIAGQVWGCGVRLEDFPE